MRGRGALALFVAVYAADLRKKGADFWSCAENEVHWHRLRETVRYVAWKPGRLPSAEHFTPLLPLWLSLKTGHDNQSKLTEEAPCPAGEVFFMLLHFLMSQLQQVRKDGSIEMNDLVAALAMLRVRIPSMSAALRSTWPIFGILAVIQQKLLKLGAGASDAPGAALKDGAAPFSEALLQFASICDEGQVLFQHLSAWLEGEPLPFAARLDALHLLRRGPGPCDGQALAVARLMAAGVLRSDVWPSPNVSQWRNDLNRLLTFLDRSLLTTSWNRMVFSGWPLLAVLHRLQEAHFRDAVCEAAGGYALLSRAVPSSVWLCVSPGEDLVAERWRSHGEFVDCSYIASLLGYGNGLFLDVGANLGACTLLVANQGFNVLALEPNGNTAKLLKAAVLRNGLEQRVRVLQVAAGQQKGHGQLKCWGHSATCQVFEGGSEVESVSLDSLEIETPRQLALKIDVEGSEEEVLLGATEVLKTRPTLFLELHSFELRERKSSSGQVVDRLLGDLGYDAVHPLFDFECQRCVAENGTYQAAAWTMESPWQTWRETRNACACRKACWQQLLQGCRCWDFDADGLCRLYRSCQAPPQYCQSADSWAGEMNGNWVFSKKCAR